MDICSKKLLEVFETEQFDAVLHLAAQTMVPVSLDKPYYDSEVNILGTVNLLEACRKTNVKRVVFSSTAAVYGNAKSVPIMEDSATKPTSFYGLSKLTVEKYLEMYNQIFGLNYVILRYANVYGERQGDGGEGGVISIFLRKIPQKESLSIYGDGGQTRDFIYAGDVAKANYQALITSHVNAVYNVSTQTEVSVNHLIEVLEQVTAQHVDKEYLPAREGDIYRSTLCNQAAKEKLDWQNEVGIVEGLQKAYKHIVN